MEAVLQRLDRLTREEAQTTATQALELVYDLVKNIGVVMDGARDLLACSSCCTDCLILHSNDYIGGSVLLDNVHQTLGVFSVHKILYYY